MFETFRKTTWGEVRIGDVVLLQGVTGRIEEIEISRYAKEESDAGVKAVVSFLHGGIWYRRWAFDLDDVVYVRTSEE